RHTRCLSDWSSDVCSSDLEWLAREGYLTFAEPVSKPTAIKDAPIDWARTVAWGDGGYYGRLFLNVKGREPEGTVDPSAYDDLRRSEERRVGNERRAGG